jgi:DNA-binding response OmpR family regulator
MMRMTARPRSPNCTRDYGLVIRLKHGADDRLHPAAGMRSDPSLAEIPFIMVTAESKTENVIAAKKAGVSNYIVKPFNAQTLKNKIDAVFGKKKSPLPRPEHYHLNSRITAFGMPPAATNVAVSAALSGRSRLPSSSA